MTGKDKSKAESDKKKIKKWRSKKIETDGEDEDVEVNQSRELGKGSCCDKIKPLLSSYSMFHQCSS